MKVVEIAGSFGLENLRLTSRETPEPGPGEVRIKMLAASLNYRDLLMVNGAYNPRQPLPLIPCSDGVGVVESVGKGVDRVAPGDRVMPCFAPRWIAGAPTRDRLHHTLGGPVDGTLAEYMVLSQEEVVHAPEYLTDAECSTLPCAALTAWSALVTQYGLSAGEWVLTQGTGGVSLFALQLAKAHGATVVITSSSDEKLEQARALGADHTINYREDPTWGKTARGMSPDKRGIDHIVEVGGGDTLEQSLRAVKFGGHISMIGVLSGVMTDLNLIPILMQNLRIQGVIVGHRDGFEAMNAAMTAHHIRPVISHTFGLDEVHEAFDVMAQGGHFGKIVITF